MPQGSVTTAVPKDTLKIDVAKECKTKKYDECSTICPSKGMLLLYGIAELALLTVNPNTVKTGTDIRIRLMEGTQQVNFSLLKEISGVTSNKLILNDPRFISRTDAMNFNRAQFTSIGESDDEMSNPLPLGY